MEEVITIVIFLLLSFLLCINWDVVSSPGLLREVLVAWKSTRDGLLNRNDSAKCIGPSSSALKATGCPCSHDTAFPKFERYPSREVWTVHVLQLLADCTHRKGVCTPPLNLENSPCTLWCLHCGLNCNLYRKKSVARDICRASCACYFHGTQMMSIMWESLCSQSSAPVASGAWHTSKSGTWNSFLLEFSRFAWTDAQKFLALSVGLWCFTETKQDVCHTSFPQSLTEWDSGGGCQKQDKTPLPRVWSGGRSVTDVHQHENCVGSADSAFRFCEQRCYQGTVMWGKHKW